MPRQTGAGAPDSNIGIVHFVNGARTYWHQHPEEQVLVVLDGECRFGSETQPATVARAGQVIRMPGGQRHWHGAVAGGSMTHISITRGGAAEWFGRVEN
jgi:quercetin dioxygenase-like cupin family protein